MYGFLSHLSSFNEALPKILLECVEREKKPERGWQNESRLVEYRKGDHFGGGGNKQLKWIRTEVEIGFWSKIVNLSCGKSQEFMLGEKMMLMEASNVGLETCRLTPDISRGNPIRVQLVSSAIHCLVYFTYLLSISDSVSRLGYLIEGLFCNRSVAMSCTNSCTIPSMRDTFMERTGQLFIVYQTFHFVSLYWLILSSSKSSPRINSINIDAGRLP